MDKSDSAIVAYFVLFLLAAAVTLFATERLSVDLVTLLLLVVLVLSGVLTRDEAFAGFASDTIVMLASIFVIGAALRDSGVLDGICMMLKRVVRGVRSLTALMMASVGVSSAFMNNTTVTAMFVGPVIALARQMKASPGRLLMPLAFSSILGGTCSLIGTSTNVAVSGYLQQHGYGGLGMFEMSPVGLVVLVTGVAYFLVLGRRVLPERGDPEQEHLGIREYLAEVVVLEGSPLIGQEVYQSDFSVLEFQVVGIRRGERPIDPSPHEEFREGDVVTITGRVENLIRIKAVEGLEILEDVSHPLASEGGDEGRIAEVVLTPRSGMIGRSLQQSRFRQRTGLSVLAVMRGEQPVVHRLASLPLKAGDVLLVQGSRDAISACEQSGGMVVISRHDYLRDSIRRGMWVLGVLALAVVLSGAGVLPASLAMLLTALFAVLTRCITLEAAYDNIDWRLIILIAGMTAFGTAMVNSGAAEMLAGGVTWLLEPLGSMAVLAGFCVLAVVLTQPMSNAAAALVVLPVAIQAATNLGLNPRSFAIAVMLSSSVSLITPLEPSCILVYNAGRYRFLDFLKVGGPLTLILLAVILAMVPWLWPLQ